MLSPFNANRLREAAGQQRRGCALEVSAYYNCEQEWNLKANYMGLRMTGIGKTYELRIYGDRFTWETEMYTAPQTLFTEAEVMQALDEVLRTGALAGSRRLPEWLFLLGARMRSVIHLR